MKYSVGDKQFLQTMNNFTDYSIGFLDGIQKGKVNLLRNIGKNAVEILKSFIDSQARLNPDSLHHVYEWYQTGSPNARLFDIKSSVKADGSVVAFTYQFTQSQSMSRGSSTPFYDKASIMENGKTIRIVPKNNQYLKFENQDGEDIFSKGPITVSNPGGSSVENSFENTIRMFFDNYFSQSYLKTSGLLDHIKNPIAYKVNIKKGAKGGKAVGEEVGYNWISKDIGGIE